jgi:predicted thioredoxin/glutaredoxin
MVSPRTPEEPPGLDDGTAAALMDEAEDFLKEVGPQVLAEVQAEQARMAKQPGWKRLFRRKP